MRTLTASAFVLEALGGLLHVDCIADNNLLANVMREIFTSPNDNDLNEPVRIGVESQYIDLGRDITRHSIGELVRGEADLVSGQEIHVIIADLFHVFIMPLVQQEPTTAQIRLNTKLCDVLVNHLTYFGYWYRLGHYPVTVH